MKAHIKKAASVVLIVWLALAGPLLFGAGVAYIVAPNGFYFNLGQNPSDNDAPAYDSATGTVIWQAFGSGTVNSGTVNRIPYYSAATTLDDTSLEITSVDGMNETVLANAAGLMIEINDSLGITESVSVTNDIQQVTGIILDSTDTSVGAAEIRNDTSGYVVVNDPLSITGNTSLTNNATIDMDSTGVGTFNAVTTHSDNASGYTQIAMEHDGASSAHRMLVGIGGSGTGDNYQDRGYLQSQSSLEGIAYIAVGSGDSHEFYAGGSAAGDLVMTINDGDVVDANDFDERTAGQGTTFRSFVSMPNSAGIDVADTGATGDVTVTITIGDTLPDNAYTVSVTPEIADADSFFIVANKTTTAFDVGLYNYTGGLDVNINWQVFDKD